MSSANWLKNSEERNERQFGGIYFPFNSSAVAAA
ncbi:hypothetical protein CfE428DRAFT_5856 [Chthoniobacter flavus Ellin428]|uniref:Uncharacterized protein n=1 Tax=Chthoniobacter flavus Ellin428 TaxID=497964 RepID=B4DAB6_9BACT|nr:hypothetical protein CfE428DRAFT_5856 [Chthoniobacter flavus Ellin428]